MYNNFNVKPFFDYANAREEIRIKREDSQLLPEEWTDDPVFKKYRFCNIFREDDKTTRWFKENIRQPLSEEGDHAKLLLATVGFRWFNKIETGEILKDIFLEKGWDSKQIRKRLKGVAPVVTGAYMIRTPRGFNKVDGIIDCVEDWLPTYKDAAEKIFACGSLEKAWEIVMGYRYLGEFMAYEIVTDLRHTCLLENAKDVQTWANPGPGAARGMCRLLGLDLYTLNRSRPADREILIKRMVNLLVMSRDPANWHYQTRKWELREVEHTLCEVDKYIRAKTGEGRPKELFKNGVK
jgi:hypothetical protein